MNNLEAQIHQAIAREQSAHGLVRLQFIRSLHQRAQQHPTLRERLEHKAQTAFDDFCEQAKSYKAPEPKTPKAKPTREALAELRQYLSHINETSDEGLDTGLDAFQRAISIQGDAREPRVKPGLRSAQAQQRYKEQQRLDQLIQTLTQQTPENPGPLNPEVLVIRLIKQIYARSPEYIKRYIDYMESLQQLEKY